MKYLYFLIYIFLVQWVLPVYATDHIAASCSVTDINAQLTISADGDRVLVPAGSCTWSGAGITLNKSVEVIGTGVLSVWGVPGGAPGGTNITRSTLGNCFTFNLTKTTRLSGINTEKCQMTSTGTPVLGKTFRVDHTTWYNATWTQNEFNGGSNCADPTARHPTGLVDHNLVWNYRFILVYGHKCEGPTNNHIYKLWNQVPPMGSGTEIIYMEDNHLGGPAGCIDWADGNWGGRIAARFNTIDSPQCYFETHGTGQTGSANRGFHWLELYGNKHVNSTQFFGMAFIRGGTGLIWGNRINSGAQGYALNNNRDTASDAPLCNGSQARDQNTPSFAGWHCQDQIGTLRDATLYSAGASWNQVNQPYYMWKNYIGAGTTKYQPFVHNSNALHIQQNRDYYLENSSFTGTAGVGIGVLASRPASCTTGVGYWATDQGSWNTSISNPYGEQQNGADGVLYTCTATNVWTLLYTPYTYPHPLQAGGSPPPPDTTPPSVPTGLTVQ